MSQNQTRNGVSLPVEVEIPLSMFSNDEKISYVEYQRDIRPPIERLQENNNEQNEDCECECESEFMADMPTNESYTLSDDLEQKEDDNAIKFLTETGMLARFDNHEQHFDLNYRSDSSVLGDIDTLSKSSYKQKENSLDNFKFFEDPFADEEFNPAETLEQQLKKDPLPEPILMEVVSEKLSIHISENEPDIEVFTTPAAPMKKSEADFDDSGSDQKPTIDTNNVETDENQNSKTIKKKLTEFGYLLQRKGFRLMRKYYKEKFEEFAKAFNYKKRVKVISPGEVNQILTQYIHSEFGTVLPVLSNSELNELLINLKCIVLSDRSNKKEPMIEGTDFTMVKNLFGKYTQKTMKAFMKDGANCFLYTHFYLIYGRSECYKQNDVDQVNFNEQMKKLMLEAFRNLFTSIKPLYYELYDSNSKMI